MNCRVASDSIRGDVERFSRQFSILVDLTDVSSQRPTATELYDATLEKALVGTSARRGSLMLLNGDRQSLELAATAGWDPVGMPERLHLDRAIANRVLTSGRALVFNGCESDEGVAFDGASDSAVYDPDSFIIVPLVTGNGVLGVVTLSDKKQGSGFDSYDLRFLSILTGQVAHTIENLRLLEIAHQVRRGLEKTVLQQEDRLQSAAGRVERAERLSSFGKLAGGVAHDFNNLMQAVLSYTRLAQEATPEDSRSHEDITQARVAAERASRLTSRLLDCGRPTRAERIFVNLNQAIRGIAPMLGRLMNEDVELTMELGKDLECIHADPTEIEQVIMNLCLNARDAMPSGGAVTIRTDKLEVEPQDSKDGPGTNRKVDSRDRRGSGVKASSSRRCRSSSSHSSPPRRKVRGRDSVWRPYEE